MLRTLRTAGLRTCMLVIESWVFASWPAEWSWVWHMCRILHSAREVTTLPGSRSPARGCTACHGSPNGHQLTCMNCRERGEPQDENGDVNLSRCPKKRDMVDRKDNSSFVQSSIIPVFHQRFHQRFQPRNRIKGCKKRFRGFSGASSIGAITAWAFVSSISILLSPFADCWSLDSARSDFMLFPYQSEKLYALGSGLMIKGSPARESLIKSSRNTVPR